jgi:hypothetical protein
MISVVALASTLSSFLADRTPHTFSGGERFPGDIIEIDVRIGFLDKETWIPVTFVGYATSSQMSDGGDMLIRIQPTSKIQRCNTIKQVTGVKGLADEDADGLLYLTARHHWRWPTKA